MLWFESREDGTQSAETMIMTLSSHSCFLAVGEGEGKELSVGAVTDAPSHPGSTHTKKKTAVGGI